MTTTQENNQIGSFEASYPTETGENTSTVEVWVRQTDDTFYVSIEDDNGGEEADDTEYATKDLAEAAARLLIRQRSGRID